MFPHQSSNLVRYACHSSHLAGVKPFHEIPTSDPSFPLFSMITQLSKYFAKSPLFKIHEENREKYYRYGPIVRETRFWHQPIVQIFHPKDFEKVFRKQGKCPNRPPNEFVIKYRKQNPQLYSNVGMSNMLGEDWLKERALVAPALLSSSTIKLYLKRQDELAHDFVSFLEYRSTTSPSGCIDDLLEASNRYSVESISMMCLDSRLNCLSIDSPTRDGDQLIKLTKTLFEAYQELYHGFPLWKYMNTRSFRKFCRTESKIYNLITPHIQRAVKRLEGQSSRLPECLLELLLRTPGLNHRDVHILLLDFIVGGVNTVSTSLCFLLFLLASNPQSQERLYEEISSTIEYSTPINEDHLSKLPYMKACLKESFRMISVVPNLVRILDQPIILSSYEIPAGIPIILNFDVLCKHSEYFQEPDVFRPERWLGEGRKKIHPFSVLPFGLGNRMCAGRRISEVELYLAMIRTIANFRLESTTKDLKLRQDFILVPAEEVKIRLIPRRKT